MSESLRRDYEIGAEIGRGRFGVVRRCSSIATAELFAVKSVDKSILSDDLDRDLADREAKLAVLASAGGANTHVVQIHAVYEDADSLHIVMDLCPGPDLFDRISRHGPLAEPEAAAVMEPLMTAVAACHRRGVAHRDIKPDNVLFDAEGRLRLADFGSAACFGGEEGLHMRGIVGTAYYAAPEVVAGREYGEKVDVWSAGVVLYMMLSGAPPFGGDTAAEVFEAVMRRNLRFPARLFRDMSPAAKDLIRRMICKDVSRRFSAEQVLESVVVVVESDKSDMDVETFYDGYLAAIMVEEGGLTPVGSAIALLAETEDEIPNTRSLASSSPTSPAAPPPAAAPSPEILASSPPPPPTPKAAPVVSTHPAAEGGRIIATPYAKKFAKDLKVELATVAGTGPMGRIVAKDVEAAAAAPTPAPLKPAPASAPVVELGSVVPFITMQGAVSRNMVESLTVPMFRVSYTINTDALDVLYKKIKSKGVTMTALLAKATALALVKHPVVNSSCRDGKSFTFNSSINIAVAVAIDGGLITPVLQDADKVDIYSLSRKWKELVDKARAKQLQPNEYNTGTFTLSNLGMFGVDRFDAILPPGTGAIMAVGGSQPAVVATKDGRIGVKSQMQVNVTADHRVIYGADLAAFLQTLSKIIEDPKDLTF